MTDPHFPAATKNNALLFTRKGIERFSWPDTDSLLEVSNQLGYPYVEGVTLAKWEDGITAKMWITQGSNAFRSARFNRTFFAWSARNLGAPITILDKVALTIETEDGKTIELPSPHDRQACECFFKRIATPS